MAPALDRGPTSPLAREIEWFALVGNLYRRERIGLGTQIVVGPDGRGSAVISVQAIGGLMARLAAGCGTPSILADDDDYPAHSVIPGAPVYRSRCGDVWFDIDSADGSVLQRLDASRRAYRWAYSALHTLDFPILMAHPRLRDVLIVSLCALGLVFSITGIVIGWRRLRQSFAG